MNNQELLNVLQKRFVSNKHRHPNVSWDTITEMLTDNMLNTLGNMEDTGGEPDCVVLTSGIYFIDMSSESPKGRRSICYDKDARIKRKKFPPETSVEEFAHKLGIEVVDEQMYLELQQIEKLDQKTSSWVKTDNAVRSLQGALFGDRRFDRAFIFHNTADCYYKDRGFRGYIKLQ